MYVNNPDCNRQYIPYNHLYIVIHIHQYTAPHNHFDTKQNIPLNNLYIDQNRRIGIPRYKSYYIQNYIQTEKIH